MTPEQLARDAARLVDRLEAAQVRRITAHLRAIERDAKSLIASLDMRDTSTSRIIREQRARLAVAQSIAAQRMIDLGRADGPLASAFREDIPRAYADGVRSATVAAVDRGLAAAVAANVVQFGPRVELELIDAMTRTTLTTLEKVSARGLTNLEDAIVRGAIRGQGPRAAGRLVRESIDLTRYEAERITRTVLMRANNEARDATYRELRVRHVQYDATNDERTCEYCEARHGMVYAMTDAPRPPLHPQCRCVLLPWSEGTPVARRGDEYYLRQREQMRGRNPDKVTTSRARAPFERADGIDAPTPVWAPGRGWL